MNFPDSHLVSSAMPISLWWLAAIVACVSWTVTKEEVFRDFRHWCADQSRHEASWFWCKFFYVWTCDYCFSHWATAGVVLFTDYHPWLEGWRGYVLGGFAVVAVANVYLVVFNIARQAQRILGTLYR